MCLPHVGVVEAEHPEVGGADLQGGAGGGAAPGHCPRPAPYIPVHSEQLTNNHETSVSSRAITP